MFCPRLVGSKWPKNLNYYFLLKHRFNHRLSMFFNVFQCFFKFQPSFMTIFNFFRYNHRNDFFPTITNYCNSCSKRWSSTILCPGLVSTLRGLERWMNYLPCVVVVINFYSSLLAYNTPYIIENLKIWFIVFVPCVWMFPTMFRLEVVENWIWDWKSLTVDKLLCDRSMQVFVSIWISKPLSLSENKKTIFRKPNGTYYLTIISAVFSRWNCWKLHWLFWC